MLATLTSNLSSFGIITQFRWGTQCVLTTLMADINRQFLFLITWKQHKEFKIHLVPFVGVVPYNKRIYELQLFAFFEENRKYKRLLTIDIFFTRTWTVPNRMKRWNNSSSPNRCTIYFFVEPFVFHTFSIRRKILIKNNINLKDQNGSGKFFNSDGVF